MKKMIFIFAILTYMVFAKDVTVSILPQKYFVEKIAKDKVNINVMVKPGASPATYEPKTSQMKLLTKSDIYFSIGVPFETVWLDRFKDANKNMLVVDTSIGIDKLKMEEHHHEEEHEDEKVHHKEEHEDKDHQNHEHGGLDPHIWLEPILVKTQAKNIYHALVKIDKENKEFYKKNLEIFLNELDDLDKKIEDILRPFQDKAFMVFHPSWGYFAKRYGLEQVSIEVEGKEPKPAQLVEIIEDAKKHNIKIVFVASQFSKKGAKTISQSINANVSTINPLALEWDENLVKVAKQIAKSY